MSQTAASQPSTIPGYTYGTASVPRAPVTLEDLELIKKSVLFTDEDVRWLRLSREVLADCLDEVLDVWYGFVGSNPHLVYYFSRISDGQPDAGYLEAVRRRFRQWIVDTASANYDQQWLDYQVEIGRRHHRSGKNRTDGVASVEHIPYRYLPALIYPITATLRPFLTRKGHPPEEVDKMWHAWLKSVILQIVLWSHPYVKEGDF